MTKYTFQYQTDGKLVECECCNTIHIRKAGWAFEENSICDRCLEEQTRLSNEIIDEILREEREGK